MKKVISNECDLIRNKHSYKEYDGKLDNKGEGLRVIRWNDNKVNIMTTFGSALPLGTCQRWDREVNANRKVTVPCPGLISYYNKNMGGIDLMDSLLGHYRIFFRGKKCFLRIFFHFLDLALNNAWLLYCRDFRQSETSSSTGKHMTLYEFKSNVSYCLRNQSRPLAKVGRPISVAKDMRIRTSKRKAPPASVIEDQKDHFPVSLAKRGTCRNTPCKGSVVTYCVKCQVYLCIGPGPSRQCFTKFHGVNIDMTNLPKFY